MKSQKSCVTCKQVFQPARSDAKYCSAVCKVKAYYHRKKKGTEKHSEHLEFFLGEYESILKEMEIDPEILPLIVYCLFRKNLKGNSSIDQIISYFNAVWPSFSKIAQSDAFQSFQESFFAGIYPIRNTSSD
jgi:hypothetical protein